jgi:hypothetical protein
MYRVFLLRQGKIAAHHEFSAENDALACRAAALAFDACTDYCNDFELWYGMQLVTSRAGLKTREIATPQANAPTAAHSATLRTGIEGIAVQILEAAMATSEALRSSARLTTQLNALRRPRVRPE